RAPRALHSCPTRRSSDLCVTNLLHKVRDPQAVVEEVYRVLKPGGKVLAVTPGRYDIDFWRRLLLPWRWWLERRWAEESGTRYTGDRKSTRLNSSHVAISY